MRRHERRVCLQDMNFIIRPSGQEIDFDVGELPCGEVVGFELGVDADCPVCVVVEEAWVVEYTWLCDIVIGEAVGDGEVAQVDGVGLLSRIGDAEVGDIECFV